MANRDPRVDQQTVLADKAAEKEAAQRAIKKEKELKELKNERDLGLQAVAKEKAATAKKEDEVIKEKAKAAVQETDINDAYARAVQDLDQKYAQPSPVVPSVYEGDEDSEQDPDDSTFDFNKTASSNPSDA